MTAVQLFLHVDHTTSLLSKLETTLKRNLDILVDILRAGQFRRMSIYLVPPASLHSAILDAIENDQKAKFPFSIGHHTHFYSLQTADFFENHQGITVIW